MSANPIDELIAAAREAVDSGQLYRDCHKRLADALTAAQQQGQSEAPINYAMVHRYASETGVDYNALSRLIRECVHTAPPPSVPEGWVLVPKSDLLEEDSYGVRGSEFYRCKMCGSESGAGVLNKGIVHSEECPLAAAPSAQGVG